MIKYRTYFKRFKVPDGSQYILRLLGFPLLVFTSCKGFGNFKICNKGVGWKNTNIHRLHFSERNGYDRGFDIGKWRISPISQKRPTKQ